MGVKLPLRNYSAPGNPRRKMEEDVEDIGPVPLPMKIIFCAASMNMII